MNFSFIRFNRTFKIKGFKMVFDKYQLKKLRILNLSQIGVSSSTRSAISRCRSRRGRTVISEKESDELMKALYRAGAIIGQFIEDNEKQISVILPNDIFEKDESK